MVNNVILKTVLILTPFFSNMGRPIKEALCKRKKVCVKNQQARCEIQSYVQYV